MKNQKKYRKMGRLIPKTYEREKKPISKREKRKTGERERFFLNGNAILSFLIPSNPF